MNRSAHRRLVTVLVSVTALAVAGLLAGCGTGQVAETADTVPAVPGANLDVKVHGGIISVRDATIDYPGPRGYQQGGSAPLTIRIVNGTSAPVTLTGATAAVGSQVVQVGGANSTAPSPAATSEPASPSTQPSGRARPSGSATAQPSATPSESPSSGPAGDTNINVSIPASPDGLIILSKANSGGTYLEIQGLTKALMPGESVGLVLTFTLADGDSVQLGGSTIANQQLVVPVAVPASPGGRTPLSLSPES